MRAETSNDRYDVLAAAFRCNADAIITFIQKDFPESVLQLYAVEVIHPDGFICDQIDLSPTRVCAAIKHQIPANRLERVVDLI